VDLVVSTENVIGPMELKITPNVAVPPHNGGNPESKMSRSLIRMENT